MKKMMLILVLTVMSLALYSLTINVPEDYVTIQSAIDVSADGDTVLVAPGIYDENIHIDSTAIVLGSYFLTTQDTSYINQTIIAGNYGTIIGIYADSTEVCGFTIENGRPGVWITSISKVHDCIIQNGISAFFLESHNCELFNLIIKNNIVSTGSNGYALINFMGWANTIKFYNSLIYNNNATQYPDNRAIFYWSGNSYSDITLQNCTITQNNLNIFTRFQGGIFPAEITNNIIWNNYQYFTEDTDLSYCHDNILQIAYNGENNYVIDPLFVSPSNENFHLTDYSFAIHRAIDSNPDSLYFDLDNNPRPNPIGSQVDFGCFETDAPGIDNSNTDTLWYVATNGNDETGNGTQANPFLSVQLAILFASEGDTVIVETGEYNQRFDLMNKSISVVSNYLANADTSYISQTIFSGTNLSQSISLTADSCSFVGFTVRNFSSASPLYISDDVFISNCIFENNSTSVILANNDYAIVNSCIFRDNTSSKGTIINGTSTDCSFINCLMYNNTSVYVYNDRYRRSLFYGWSGLRVKLYNSTIVSNTVNLFYGMYGPNITIQNSILYDNYEFGNCGGTFSYNIIEGGVDGDYIFDVEPGFFDEANNNFYLSDSSFSIGRGTNNFPALASTDFDGNPRPNPEGYMPDLGCFEHYNGGPVIDETRTVWNISTTGNNTTGDGSNSNPFETISLGVTYASDGDTILVATGSYYENINPFGKNLKLYSHYATTADTSFISNTIIDGEMAGPVVRYSNNETSTSELIGFTLKNGKGVYQSNSAGTWTEGKGIYIENSSPLISKNKIIDSNSTVGLWSYGGGIYCENSNSLISYNLFSNNKIGFGAGVFAINSSVSIENNYFFNNTALGFLNPNTFIDLASGGGIYIDIGCSNSIISNNLFANNSSIVNGGAIHLRSSATVKNNTIFSNNSENGGGIAIKSANPVLQNNIIWNNSASSLGNQVYLDVSSILTEFKYNDIEGGFFEIGGAGAGSNFAGIYQYNLYLDPQFVDSANLDLHLLSSSPCIDLGNPNDDYANEPLPNGERLNMGFYGNTVEATTSSQVTPIVFDLTPKIGSMIGGTEITITGARFGENQNNGVVLFGVSEAETYMIWLDTLIVVNTPAHSEGYVNVTIENDLGTQFIMNDEFYFASNQMIVSGDVFGTWSTDEWPTIYILDGTVTVPQYMELTIEAGVQVIADININSDSKFVVNGNLAVNGTSANPVIFSTASGQQQAGNWKGIEINLDDENAEVTIDNAIIEYAENGIKVSKGYTSQTIVSNTTIQNNSISDIFCYADYWNNTYSTTSSLSLNHCKISDAPKGLFIETTCEEYSAYAKPTLNNCSFENNSTAIYLRAYGDDPWSWTGSTDGAQSSPFFKSCSFNGNQQIVDAYAEGSEVYGVPGGRPYHYSKAYTNPSFINCLFFNNTNGFSFSCPDYDDSRISFAEPIFTNSTIHQESEYILTLNHLSTLTSMNSIFSGYSQSLWSGSTNGDITIEYSCIPDSISGENNIFGDPLYNDQVNFDFSLNQNSPCINSANPDTIGLNLPEMDIYGNPRIMNIIIDMGAYEYQGIGINNPPSTPTFVQIDVINDNAILTWDEVNTTVLGSQIEVDYYLIYHSYNPYGNFMFFDSTSETTYTHERIGIFSDKMYYRISAYIGTRYSLDLYIQNLLIKQKKISKKHGVK